MIFINYKNNPPSQELIDEGRELTKQLLLLPEIERKKYIEKHSDYWRKLEAHLASLSYGKCWYTEAHDIASVYHVDHFRPKNETKKLTKDCKIETDNNPEPYWWLAFAWENYRYSGSIPNTSKNAYFPLRKGSMIARKLDDVEKEWTGLLDPTVEEDVLWLTFGEDGKAYPACDDDLSWEAQRVYLSVRVYNLNAPSLIDARVEIQNDCKRRINKIIKLMSDKENNYNVLIRDESKDQIQELRKMLNPKSELSAVAKCYILNRPESFIRRIATV